MIGSPIRKEIRIARYLEETKKSARMMKDTTGIVRIASISGARSSEAALKRADSAASRPAARRAARKPPVMCSRE